jgi:hypothetical protein
MNTPVCVRLDICWMFLHPTFKKVDSLIFVEDLTQRVPLNGSHVIIIGFSTDVGWRPTFPISDPTSHNTSYAIQFFDYMPIRHSLHVQRV